MSYVVLTIFSSLFLAMYDFFKKISVKGKKDIYEILFFFTFISFLCCLFFTNDAFKIDLKNICFILLKTIVIGLGWFFTTKSMSKLELGIVVPFSLLGSVFTTIFAFLFFKEKIGFAQIGGILIISIGLLFLSRLCKKEEGEKDYRYLILLVLAAFLSSISAIIDRDLLYDIDKRSVLFWFFFFLSSIYLIICLFKYRKISFNNFRSNLWVIGIGVSIFLSDLFYYWALSYEGSSLALVSIIRKLSVFIGVVLGGVFLKEGNLVKKIMILLLMFFGLTFIIFMKK